MATIKCDDCGNAYEARRPNAKYCEICRVLRFCLYNKLRTRECWICDKEFVPLSRDDVACGACDIPRAKWHGGTCALCKSKSDRLIHESIAVCAPCATDPKQRPLFVRALAKKRGK